jgi:hypothetical protein
MTPEILGYLLEAITKRDAASKPGMRMERPREVKGERLDPNIRVKSRVFSYAERNEEQWVNPEYDFATIQIAEDTDSYIFRALEKKTNRLILAGWDFVGRNPDTVAYIRRRLSEIAVVSRVPTEVLLTSWAHDLARYSNSLIVKVRDTKASTGLPRKTTSGKTLQPVAGYFILPFETLTLKAKANGDLLKVCQNMPSGRTVEFDPEDVIHSYTNRKPGFLVGTPSLEPVLDDVRLLRRLEENIEELVESNLFPLFHYQIGTDEHPERIGPDGESESDKAKRSIEYMPASGMYITSHRHKIAALGSEGKALRVDYYLTYFKQRVFAGLGMSAVDFGEGDTANNSTAQTLSKSAIQDVEALQLHIKVFFEAEVIRELLLESPWGVAALSPENIVSIKFGIIDKEERSREQNAVTQLFNNNLVTQSEARHELGKEPYVEEDLEDTCYHLFTEPLALIKSMGPFSAASETLAAAPASGVTEEGVKKEEEGPSAKRGQVGRPVTRNPAANAAANKANPANQHGKRGAQKYTNDWLISQREEMVETIVSDLGEPWRTRLGDEIREGFNHECVCLNSQTKRMGERFRGVIYDSGSWRFEELQQLYNAKAQNLKSFLSGTCTDKSLLCITIDESTKVGDIPPFRVEDIK